ncbi:MAG: hypothetical protein DMD91_26240 [Candidatus Rokuibacteriota bacterium]|nr:MAG: hypothetical protein DMD91_26240 [Candidatus Rokubacteria bacterium]
MTKASTGKRVKAYVLIETAAGKAKVVKKSLSRIKSGPSTMVHLDGITFVERPAWFRSTLVQALGERGGR